ncbi:response regulator [Sphingosinicella sp. BN140058]|uniref:response regulator n=1 Tax=Sphingosinicella sp. BN140058 TaxID=1892855 RepID=UPI0010109E2E|nr:response regulator [Sphingosinicella sp. BN140058]QAY75418.1 response regulator [Sphingosinicella sp. BN140058]
MILVVDDEAAVRATIGQALAELGYRVRAAETGEQALALIREAPPQLVILDYVMPGMDGAEVARQIAAIDAALPVIFSTGHGALRALRESAGVAASVLEKPFTLAELDSLIARTLGTTPRLRPGS